MASVAFVGVIVLSNSLFAANYMFVRSERRLADAKTEEAKSREGTTEVEKFDDEAAGGSSDSPEKGDPMEEWFMTAYFCGLCCGAVKKQRNAIRKFLDWRPIRYRLGLLSTSALLVLFAVLFSEGVLKKLGANTGEVGTPQLCKNEARHEHVADVHIFLEEATNIRPARRQYEYTKVFFNALRNDTNLYGTNGYECPLDPRTKYAFYNSDGYGKESGLHFFPGHCLAAQELALKAAREQTCNKNICVDETIEVEVPKVKDNTWQVGVGWFTNGAEGVVEMTTETRKLSGCERVVVPCPDHAEVDERDEILQDYKWEQMKRAEEMAQTEKISEIKQEYSEEVKETGEAVIAALIRQIDIASSAYIAYRCVSIFFPSPVYIFRSSYTVAIKRVLFGAQKHVFILVILAIWWGVKYFQSFQISLQLQLYVQNLLYDPCYGDAEFLANASTALSEVCDEILPMESEWNSMSSVATNILEEVQAFKTSCQCDFPCVSMCEVMSGLFSKTFRDDLESIHFGTKLASTQDGFCSSCDGVDIVVQNSDATFLGNSTVCDDPASAKQQFLDSEARDSYLDGWELWIQSGLLASLLVKTFIANFGVAIMHLADPLSSCDGEYEGPPGHFEFARSHTSSALRHVCESNLKMIAVRWSIIWGGLTNICLLNIMASTFRTDDGTYEVPKAVGIGLIVAAAVPPLLSYCFTRRTNQRISELKGKGEDEGSTDQELDPSSSDEDTVSGPPNLERQFSG